MKYTTENNSDISAELERARARIRELERSEASCRISLENQLTRSREKYQALVDNLTDIVYTLDSSFHFVSVNSRARKYYGYSKKELYEEPALGFVHENDRKRIIDAFSKALENRTRHIRGLQFRFLRNNGKPRWVEINSFNHYDREGAFEQNEGILKDITDQVLARENLAQSELKYRKLFEASTDAIFLETIEGRILDCNRTACRLYGYSKKELTGMTVADIVPAEIAEKLDSVIETNITRGGTFLEALNMKKNGDVFPVEVSTKVINISDKHYVVAYVRDITEHKIFEQTLIESEAKFRALTESTASAIFIIQGEYYCYANRAFEKTTGYSLEDLKGKKYWEIVHPDYQDLTRNRGIARQAGEDVPTRYEFKIIRKDGEERWVDFTASFIEYDNMPALMGSTFDITERKKAEEELQKTSKIESLGILAGGIAHDFNNLLTVIMGGITLAKDDRIIHKHRSKILTEAEGAAVKAKELTQQLLTFSRGGVPVKKVTSIPDLLRDTTDFILRGSSVKCKYRIAGDLMNAEIDEGQISQVIQNLALNAVQASPESGIINISAENTRISEGSTIPLEPGEYIRIAIRDHGQGIPHEHLDKIFDPYFTTKIKGHGLGLSVCYSIIKNHDGHISVRSKINSGTTFRIFLPASHIDIADKEKPKIHMSHGKGKILLMDDEDMILSVTSKMIKTLGFEVEVSRDGEEAIRKYRQAKESGEPFDLVIMDMTVPGGMGGRETIGVLSNFDPAIKAIVSSGYSNDPVMAHFSDYGFSGVLSKPFNFDNVREIIYRILD